MQQLSQRQQTFVDHYVSGLPLIQAAIKAGYAERSASVQASRLLEKDNILDAIEKAKKKAFKAPSVSIAWVTEQFLEMAKLAQEQGNIKDWHKAVDSIAKHLGFYELDNKQRAPLIVIGADPGQEQLTRKDQLKAKLAAAEAAQGQVVEGQVVDRE